MIEVSMTAEARRAYKIAHQERARAAKAALNGLFTSRTAR
jgi:hypothetical protein